MNMNDGGLMVVDSDVSNFSHAFSQKLKHGTWDHMGSNHSQPVCEAWTVTYLYRGLMFGDGETWHKHRCISVQLRPASYGWPVRPEDGLDRMGLMLGGSDEDNKAVLVLFMAAWYCLVAVGFGCQLSKLQTSSIADIHFEFVRLVHIN